MHILFITAKHIGDAILSTTIMEHLHKQYPLAQFTVICGEKPASILQAPYIKKIIPIKKKIYRLHWIDIWYSCRGKKWDLIIDLRGSVLSYLLNSKRCLIWRPQNTNAHKIKQLANFMKVNSLPEPKIYISKEANEKAAPFLKGLKEPIILGSTANWHAKRWDNHKFAKLAHSLQKELFPTSSFVVLGASGDESLTEELCSFAPKNLLIPLVGKMDLLTTAAFLKKSRLFIGNDSGLMHLSAAVGIPTLGLFGPSKESVYAPVGKHTHWVRTYKSYAELVETPDYDQKNTKNMMEGLSVEKVLKAVKVLEKKVKNDS